MGLTKRQIHSTYIARGAVHTHIHILNYLNASANKCVLSLFLKMLTFGDTLMSCERISQSFGVDTKNARSPWTEVVGGMASKDSLEDLKVRAEGAGNLISSSSFSHALSARKCNLRKCFQRVGRQYSISGTMGSARVTTAALYHQKHREEQSS